MRWVRPSDAAAVDRLLAASASERPTYVEVGDTLNGGQPAGYRHDRLTTVLGHGPDVFRRARTGLQTWQAHRVPGIRVLSGAAPVRPGGTVVVVLGTRSLALAAPCRIVGVTDGPDRWGFAYGTLPGHPEQGEEAFVVSMADDGDVRFEITAFSRPGDPLTGLLGPLGRTVQGWGTKGYLRALRHHVDRGV